MKKGDFSRSFLFVIFGIGMFMGLSVLFVSWLPNWRSSSKKEVKYESTAASEYNVLFITASTEDYDVLQKELKGLRSRYPSSVVDYDVEYCDSKRFNTRENENYFYQHLNYKIHNYKKFDAVIAGDDESLSFIEKYQQELFPELPVIFFGVDDYEHAVRAVRNKNITGFVHLIKLTPLIDTALKRNSRLKKIVGIYDDTPTGRGYSNQFYSFAKLYPSLNFEGVNVSSLTEQQIVERLSSYSADTAVIYLYATTDAEDQKYSVKDFTSLLISYADDCQIYSVNSASVEDGLLAGNIVNTEESAAEVAELTYRIITGEISVSSVSLNMKIPSTFVVNHDVMKEKNVGKNVFPARTVYLHDNPGFWETNGQVTLAFCLIIISLIALIAEILLSEKKIKIEKAKSDYHATHDFLTGLPNRRQARKNLVEIIKSNQDFSVALIDIDDFKNINDFFSHLCGDVVLREEAKRLLALEQEDPDFSSARFGGDEFVVIHKGGFLNENSMELYRLKSLLNEPVKFNGKKLFIKVSIGVVNSYQSEKQTEDIMTNADLALYEAKSRGKNNCVFFTKDMKKTAIRNDEVSKKLEAACQKGLFEILYQPQVDLGTGKIYGYEALTRLSDYSFPPSVFIPIAEEYGYISKLGRIVTEKVIAQMSEWKKNGVELHRVSINFSSGQLGDLDYPVFLKGLLEKYDIEPELIQIEITESLYMSNSAYAKELFKTFEDMGISIALDDFGTGYSSLSYLSYMPVDTVKIDKSMVDNYLLTENESSFIKNISRLIHGLGMKLTVEGVEEQWQLDRLKTVHADYIQGYYFSKPISAKEVETFKIDA